LAYFSTSKITHPKRHVYHAKHHNFTIEKPRSKPRFSQNTLKTSTKTAKPRVHRGSTFFLETTS